MKEEQIFHDAIERPVDQRAAYLQDACGDDDDLRERVDVLLRAHANPGSFLESPAVSSSATVDQPVTEKPGAVVGPYKLLQQIGEGGMGVVFMAEQIEPLQRTVALKIIKPGMDTRQVIARFEAERQAVAMMDHPNIAKVLDAGTTDSGRPYFVMELVKGVPITTYCDEKHLPLRARLELLLPVCQAVQHAHQKGVIHRDIKPTNVLVAEYDNHAVPKVIDFGVAKATAHRLTERTMFTEFGQLVGTMEYMSPEQAKLNQLDIDTRSDIYSLGVLLYELLTGSTPFEGKRLHDAAFDEMLRIIREEEPPKPSTRLSTTEGLPSIAANRGSEPVKLNRLVRGELDWIVMKALEKDRNRRYATASAFATDLGHYLLDEAVEACPPSAWYRIGKFALRYKAALTMMSVVALAALLLVGSIGWMLRDRGAREQEMARDRATRQAAIDGEVDLALKEAERWQEQGKWPEALSAVKQAEGVLAVGGGDAVRERARQLRNDLTMVLRLEEFRTQRVRTETNYESQNAAYLRLFVELGINVENLTPPEIATRIARRPATVVPVAAALDDWAQVLRDWGLWERTRDPEIWKRVLEAARLADPDPWRSRLRQLVGQEDWTALTRLADASDMTELPVESLEQMGNALMFGGDGPAGVAWLQKAHQLHPDDALISFYLAFHLSHMPSVDWVEALRFAEAALATRPSATMHEFVGNVQKELGRRDEAIASYRESIRLNPDDQMSRFYLADVLRQVQLENAVAEYREAIRLEPSDALAHFHLGRALYNQQKLGEAIDSYLKSIELDPKYSATYTALGNAYRDQGKLEQAVAVLRKGVELDPKNAHAQNDLGSSLYHQKKLDEAIACCEKAIELDPKFALAFARLGNALRDQGKLDEAIAAYRQSVMLESEIVGDAPKLGTILRTYEVWLSLVLVERAWQLAAAGDPKLHDPGRAIELAQEAGALIPNWGHSLKTLGVAHYRAGHWQAAALALEDARQSYRKDSVILFYLSMAHGRLNHTEQARRYFDEAAQWRMGLGFTDEEMRRLCAEAATLLGLGLPLTFHEPPVLIPGPTLLKPAAGATMDNGSRDGSKPMVWDFDWSDVPGATQYHLYVFGATEDFIGYNDPTLASSSFQLDQRGYTDNLHLGHHWKVRALVSGAWSDWSEERTFTVAPLDDNKPSSPK